MTDTPIETSFYLEEQEEQAAQREDLERRVQRMLNPLPALPAPKGGVIVAKDELAETAQRAKLLDEAARAKMFLESNMASNLIKPARQKVEQSIFAAEKRGITEAEVSKRADEMRNIAQFNKKMEKVYHESGIQSVTDATPEQELKILSTFRDMRGDGLSVRESGLWRTYMDQFLGAQQEKLRDKKQPYLSILGERLALWENSGLITGGEATALRQQVIDRELTIIGRGLIDVLDRTVKKENQEDIETKTKALVLNMQVLNKFGYGETLEQILDKLVSEPLYLRESDGKLIKKIEANDPIITDFKRMMQTMSKITSETTEVGAGETAKELGTGSEKARDNEVRQKRFEAIKQMVNKEKEGYLKDEKDVDAFVAEAILFEEMFLGVKVNQAFISAVFSLYEKAKDWGNFSGGLGLALRQKAEIRSAATTLKQNLDKGEKVNEALLREFISVVGQYSLACALNPLTRRGDSLGGIRNKGREEVMFEDQVGFLIDFLLVAPMHGIDTDYWSVNNLVMEQINPVILKLIIGESITESEFINFISEHIAPDNSVLAINNVQQKLTKQIMAVSERLSYSSKFGVIKDILKKIELGKSVKVRLESGGE